MIECEIDNSALLQERMLQTNRLLRQKRKFEPDNLGLRATKAQKTLTPTQTTPTKLAAVDRKAVKPKTLKLSASW